MTEEVVQPKRPRGRPRKNPVVEREPARAPQRAYNMRAKPNWVDVDPMIIDSNNELHISADRIPDGLSMMWVRESVHGQPDPRNRMKFEQGGWTPVHQDDFDGQFNGIWMQKDAPGEINHGGLVLMARPNELQRRARLKQEMEANEAIRIREAALKGGDIPDVTMDTQHPSARQYNRINRTMERVQIPDDK